MLIEITRRLVHGNLLISYTDRRRAKVYHGEGRHAAEIRHYIICESVR